MNKGNKVGIVLFILILIGSLGGFGYYHYLTIQAQEAEALENAEPIERDPNFNSIPVLEIEVSSDESSDVEPNRIELLTKEIANNISNDETYEIEETQYYICTWPNQFITFRATDLGGLNYIATVEEYNESSSYYRPTVEEFIYYNFEMTSSKNDNYKTDYDKSIISDLMNFTNDSNLTFSEYVQKNHIETSIISSNEIICTICKSGYLKTEVAELREQKDAYTGSFYFTYLVELKCTNNDDENSVGFPKEGETESYLISAELSSDSNVDWKPTISNIVIKKIEK